MSIMEGILVSAATGALTSVLEKLAHLLVNEYKLHKGDPGDIQSLTDELTFMHAFLLKMSEEENPDAQDKAWMAAVRELSYDIEDSLDDFMQAKDTKPDGLIKTMLKNVMNMVGMGGMMKRHNQMFQDLKKRAIEVGEMSERYRTRQPFSNTKNATVDPRALVIFEDASKLVGIDRPKAELIKMLSEDEGSSSTHQQQPQNPHKRKRNQQVKMVSIVGSGGMGKTTLANQVYRDLKGKFPCRAFVSVSRNPDVMNILRTILSEVSDQRYAHTEAGSIQQVINNINNCLANKRYFIVVDDIWENETWDAIKYSFPMSSFGVIIITTRSKCVANSCQLSFGGHIYNIKPLDIVHSRQLFYGRLFKHEEYCPSYLKEVSEQILVKCDGLPLAIIAISGLLANKERSENLWNEVKDSIGRALERNATIELMMKILSLSYYDLPLHLKTCLLYMSLFPEDSIIEKKGLIRRWIAEGFIRKEGRYTLHELGERCFNELINRSLIQHVRTNEYGEVSCRVHDIVLDFIISKSTEENFVTFVVVPNQTVETQRKARRLSVQVTKEGKSIIPTSMVLSHVRSLNVFGDVFGDIVEIPSLGEFRHLRALDFGDWLQPLENCHLENIGRLFQLRYVNLKGTKVNELPEDIGHLGCLEMLDLRGTEVRELPESIVNLRKLSHLLVGREVKFPSGIAKMQALEMLKFVGVFSQTFDILKELGQLKNVMKLTLNFEGCYDAGDVVREGCYKAIVSCLHNLGTQNLRSITIWSGCNFLRQGPLCPLPVTLQKLMLSWSSDVPRVPDWMGSLVNLQQLRLYVNQVGQEGLCILGGLPALQILQLIGQPKEPFRLTISGEVGFRCLRKLDYVHRLMDLTFAAGAMPNLETIEIYFDTHSFLIFNQNDDLDLGMENLPCLITVKCTINDMFGDEDIVDDIEAAMKRAASAHPNRPTLLIERLE